MAVRQDQTVRKGTERKPDFLPLIANAFVENGFRRTTTADLARTCGVRENELYRIWPSKKVMFLDSIQYLFDTVTGEWSRVIEKRDQRSATAAEHLIEWQSKHRGDSRLHRIIFTGLGEIDDPEIRKALRKLYRKFHEVLVDYVSDHRKDRGVRSSLGDEATAWAMIGLGSIFDIQHDLSIGSMKARRQILAEATTTILNIT